MRAALLACLLAAAASDSVAASGGAAGPPQDPPARPSIPGILSSDIHAAYADALAFFEAPLSFGRAEWSTALSAGVATGVLMAGDEALHGLLSRDARPAVLDRPFHWAEEWGRLRTMQYASLGLYAAGLLSGSDDVRVTGRLMGEALLLAGLPAITLQYGLGRSRPHAGKGAWDYNYLEWSNERQSLPSGHAVVAFAVSTVLAKRIDRTWASVPLYAAAALTAMALAWNNQHWPSDLFVGSALGYLAASHVVERERKRSGEAGRRGEDGGRTREERRVGFGFGQRGVTVRFLLP